MVDALFLDADELRTLTGFSHKARQVEQLRRMGVPFYVNARGAPVVACSVVQGGSKAEAKPPPKRVVPRLFTVAR